MLFQSFLATLLAVISIANAQYCDVTNAICRIENGTVNGQLNLTSYYQSGLVGVTGIVQGLSPGFHGFHVHQFGDLSDGCKAAGEHFNPYNLTHGAETDAIRHVGDLGNIAAGGNGVAYVNKLDREIKLCGPNSVLGRAIVVHAMRDDLGRGGNAESLKSGNSGARIGCCVIAVSPQPC